MPPFTSRLTQAAEKGQIFMVNSTDFLGHSTHFGPLGHWAIGPLYHIYLYHRVNYLIAHKKSLSKTSFLPQFSQGPLHG
jgi:hypothetical protein